MQPCEYTSELYTLKWLNWSYRIFAPMDSHCGLETIFITWFLENLEICNPVYETLWKARQPRRPGVSGDQLSFVDVEMKSQIARLSRDFTPGWIKCPSGIGQMALERGQAHCIHTMASWDPSRKSK